MTAKTRLPVYPNFDSAAREVLTYLYKSLGFSLWMVTRTEGEDWIVLQALDKGYGVKDGDVFRWTDSFCSRMVRGEGPQIAPDSQSVPAYASAPIGQQVPIGAYVGVPLESADGALFGTLCAIDPDPQPDAIRSQLPLVQVFSRLLSSILVAELRSDREARRAERLKAQALRDPLTGLANRRAWDQFLAGEEARCRRYGHPACVFSIDLDDLKELNDSEGHSAGDALLRKAASVLRRVSRTTDLTARLGGDEFGVLAPETDAASGAVLLKRLEASFAKAGVAASIGMATRDPAAGLAAALRQADDLMYAAKIEGRGRRVAPTGSAAVAQPA